MNIDELPAGPEMDAAVTEALDNCAHVLKWVGIGHGSGRFKCEKCHEFFAGSRYRIGLLVRPYSTDIAAAWEVHQAASAMLFSKRKAYFKAIQEQTRLEDGSLVAWPDVLVALINVFPEAICRAFLKAKGVTL